MQQCYTSSMSRELPATSHVIWAASPGQQPTFLVCFRFDPSIPRNGRLLVRLDVAHDDLVPRELRRQAATLTRLGEGG